MERNAAAGPDDIAGGEVPAEIIMLQHLLGVRDEVDARKRDQENVDPGGVRIRPDRRGQPRYAQASHESIERPHGWPPERLVLVVNDKQPAYDEPSKVE